MSLTNGVITPLPAPAGYIVNFEDPQRQGLLEAYLVIGIGSFLTLLFVLQRVYTKLKIVHNFNVEDWCLIAAWLFTVAIQAIEVRGFSRGEIGVHGWEINMAKYNDFVIVSIQTSSIYRYS